MAFSFQVKPISPAYDIIVYSETPLMEGKKNNTMITHTLINKDSQRHSVCVCVCVCVHSLIGCEILILICLHVYLNSAIGLKMNRI